MKRIGHYAVGVLRGDEVLFSDFQDGGEMWTGTGSRSLRQRVEFADSFIEPPTVHVGLSMWDIDSQQNQRVDIGTEEVGRSGFTIVFSTWGDTRVARVRAQWLAIGPVTHDDDWEV
ncbi:H-type lectin domain-containing protein [Paracoccus isoporae]|uniref:H-type lectin domain-containing protein n=1 Tax=Paracoccus isoporae TaxID=591205 RepID=A0A1G7BL19_9RHOB|nr:H-type lectin domain-containing protein [Paracoccus isoporae]SDE27729.1 H-type lectin domain-containing protein [Paracoccus isoporae]